MKSMKSMISYPLPRAHALRSIKQGRGSVEGGGESSTSSTSSIGGRAHAPSGPAPMPWWPRAAHPLKARQRSMNPLARNRAHRINGLAVDLHSLCTGGAA